MEEEDLSNIPTAPDSEGPGLHHEQWIRLRLRRQTPRWYDPVVKFWRAQVSITIDEGQHRDHLGAFRHFLSIPMLYDIVLMGISSRENVPGVPPHLARLRHGRRRHCAIVPSAACLEPESESRLLYSRSPACGYFYQLRSVCVADWCVEVLETAECDYQR